MPVNKVFIAVKKYYLNTALPPDECFSCLRSELDINEEQLGMHLQILKNMKLIDFVEDNPKHIALTPLGADAGSISSVQI
jgi:hypothetical protein